jgi:hypothetical protein
MISRVHLSSAQCAELRPAIEKLDFIFLDPLLPAVCRQKILFAKSSEIECVYEDMMIAILKLVRELPTIAPLGTNNPICGAQCTQRLPL